MLDLENKDTPDLAAQNLSQKLEEQIKAFQAPAIKAQVENSQLVSFSQPGITKEKANAEAQETNLETEQEQPEVQEQNQEEENSQQEERPATEFEAAFENYFGLKPEEALDVVNQLMAFRDEMYLMRYWGVSPSEYDQRMQTIKQFFTTLPEEGKAQFNSVEGAIAIWDYLVRTNQATPSRKPIAQSSFSRTKPTASPKPDIIKKSEILRMDKQTYQANLPRIVQAFKEGRVVEDV
jgi:hypothetical protein